MDNKSVNVFGYIFSGFLLIFSIVLLLYTFPFLSYQISTGLTRFSELFAINPYGNSTEFVVFRKGIVTDVAEDQIFIQSTDGKQKATITQDEITSTRAPVYLYECLVTCEVLKDIEFSSEAFRNTNKIKNISLAEVKGGDYIFYESRYKLSEEVKDADQFVKFLLIKRFSSDESEL